MNEWMNIVVDCNEFQQTKTILFEISASLFKETNTAWGKIKSLGLRSAKEWIIIVHAVMEGWNGSKVAESALLREGPQGRGL